MATSEEQGGDRGSGESGGCSEASKEQLLVVMLEMGQEKASWSLQLQDVLLAKVDLLVPFTPNFCGSEHAS